jgi:hypothetical protein
VTVGDVQTFLRSLSALLAANQGGKPATEFEAFCAGLDPFQTWKVADLAQFLKTAEQYQRTGELPVPTGRGGRAAKPRATKTAKVPLKKKTDVEDVQAAAAKLRDLYERATDPALSHEQIEAEVAQIHAAFDTEGLKAVAKEFGVSSGLTSKDAARARILHRITERKGRHERNQVIAEGFKPPAPDQATPAADEEPVVAEVVESPGAGPTVPD